MGNIPHRHERQTSIFPFKQQTRVVIARTYRTYNSIKVRDDKNENQMKFIFAIIFRRGKVKYHFSFLCEINTSIEYLFVA